MCHKPSLKTRGKGKGEEKKEGRKGAMAPLCSLETEKWCNYAEKWADATKREVQSLSDNMTNQGKHLFIIIITVTLLGVPSFARF